jgi:hypothetical protein
MPFIKLKNKNVTTGKTPPSGNSSWLEFWETEKDEEAATCEVRGCDGEPDVGGHVIKSGEGGKEYILPICYGCNNKPDGEEFEGWEYDLVPVK